MQAAAFNQKSWQERKRVLGAPAETVFEIFCRKKNIRFEHFGMKEESSLQYWKLQLFLRLRPDYICQHGSKTILCEVKGCGSDAVLKFKLESLEALYSWQLIMPVYIFLWDSNKQRYSFIAYEALRQQLYQCQLQRFENDNKPYFALPVSQLQWETL